MSWPRQCCLGIPQVSQSSDLALVLAQKNLYALFSIAARVSCLPQNHQRVCPLLPWMLRPVSLSHTPPQKLFSTPSRFVGHREFSITPSFWFHTHLIEVAISVPQRAYTCLLWPVFYRLDSRCAASIALMNCRIPSASVKIVFISCGMLMALTVWIP